MILLYLGRWVTDHYTQIEVTDAKTFKENSQRNEKHLCTVLCVLEFQDSSLVLTLGLFPNSCHLYLDLFQASSSVLPNIDLVMSNNLYFLACTKFDRKQLLLENSLIIVAMNIGSKLVEIKRLSLEKNLKVFGLEHLFRLKDLNQP